MDDFYADRDNTMPSLQWSIIAPPFTKSLIASPRIQSATSAKHITKLRDKPSEFLLRQLRLRCFLVHCEVGIEDTVV